MSGSTTCPTCGRGMPARLTTCPACGAAVPPPGVLTMGGPAPARIGWPAVAVVTVVVLVLLLVAAR